MAESALTMRKEILRPRKAALRRRNVSMIAFSPLNWTDPSDHLALMAPSTILRKAGWDFMARFNGPVRRMKTLP